ncbi:unnamed protein product [Arabidopsis thaliana]|uniref:Uncharacterized protein n=1 Tax=Arabidopsis thaliana TaxID=3702 RepID=A0A5S9XI85_ARATH|nr:unnamed protein product [Arabidopsis thaliana]
MAEVRLYVSIARKIEKTDFFLSSPNSYKDSIDYTSLKRLEARRLRWRDTDRAIAADIFNIARVKGDKSQNGKIEPKWSRKIHPLLSLNRKVWAENELRRKALLQRGDSIAEKSSIGKRDSSRYEREVPTPASFSSTGVGEEMRDSFFDNSVRELNGY